jgi:hypothetical protein
MTFASRLAAVTFAALMCWTVPASAQQAPPLPPPQRQPSPYTYGPDELVGAGHKFFGNVSRGLASVIERAVSQWGLPNGYILGEEGSGAFVAGLRYGEGTLYTKNAGDLRVYWQGPSVGFDWGGDGARTMTLVLQPSCDQCDLPALRRHRRLGLYCRRLRDDRADLQQHRAGADPLRPRPATWRQYRLSQIHPARDLEPVLTAPPKARPKTRPKTRFKACFKARILLGTDSR